MVLAALQSLKTDFDLTIEPFFLKLYTFETLNSKAKNLMPLIQIPSIQNVQTYNSIILTKFHIQPRIYILKLLNYVKP